MASLPDDAEGALTLCAAVESLTEPVTAFIRLAESKGGFDLESTPWLSPFPLQNKKDRKQSFNVEKI